MSACRNGRPSRSGGRHALARELKIPFVSNQPQYSMLWRVIEAEVIPACEKLGMGQIVWSPMAQGVLSGKYLPGRAAAGGQPGDERKRWWQFIARFMTDDVLTRVQQLQPIAQEAGLTMAQLAVAWVLQNRNVSSAIVGATRPEQVRENVKASGVGLEADIMKRIDEVLGDVVERDPAHDAESGDSSGDAFVAGPRPRRHGAAATVRADDSSRSSESVGRREGHRVVDPVALAQGHLSDFGFSELTPGLTNHVSASDWLVNSSTSGPLTSSPSAFSYRHVHGIASSDCSAVAGAPTLAGSGTATPADTSARTPTLPTRRRVPVRQHSLGSGLMDADISVRRSAGTAHRRRTLVLGGTAVGQVRLG